MEDTLLSTVSIVAVLVEIISTYSLYMYGHTRYENLVTAYRKRGRILTYVGESIGIASAVLILFEITVLGANVSDRLYIIVVLISVFYLIVEGLVISTIYRAFDNTRNIRDSRM